MFVATQSANYATVSLIYVNNITKEAVNDLVKEDKLKESYYKCTSA